jgi:hypothetical protein
VLDYRLSIKLEGPAAAHKKLRNNDVTIVKIFVIINFTMGG